MVERITGVRSGEGAYASLDDRILVLDFQAGNPEAFVEIHRRYSGLARHVCRRYLPEPQDADEALQETMIRVFQGLHRFNGQYALRPWIARIATNVSLDIIRRQARRPLSSHLEEAEREDPSGGPEEAVERLVQRDLVLSVLADMPETHRHALVLRELEHLSHREIAENLNITSAQAKALIHRAKGSFRRRWMEKVAERGGVMGFALAPMLLLLRALNGARRVSDRVAQVAAVAPEVAANAAATTSVPVVSATAERLVAAAAVTVLVAGTVTGVAVVNQRVRDREPSDPAPAAIAAPPLPTPSPVTRVVTPPAEPSVRAADGRHPPLVDDATPTPSETATPTPDASPSTDPGQSPTPPPTEEPPPPVVLEPPAWTGSFGVDWASEDLCDCGPGVVLKNGTTSGQLTAETSLSVTQEIEGASQDAEGDAAWALSADLEAELAPAGGSVTLTFSLGSGRDTGHYAMAASAPTLVGVPGQDAVTYVFFGRYTSVGATEGPIPNDGWGKLRISVWSDGISISAVDFSAGR